jgi:hypothetical protein
MNLVEIHVAEETRTEAPAKRSAGLVSVQGAMLVALLLGLGYRALQYAVNRSLWLDELLVLPLLKGHSLAELALPRSVSPLAPGWLVLEKLAALAFGTGELSLRLVPFLAGVASLFAFRAIARRTLAPAGAAAALAVFAFSPYLVYYASEVKPYATDVLVSLLLVWQALVLRERGVTPLRAAALAGTGLLAVFFSLPSAFVLAGTTLALLAAFVRAGDRRSAGLLVAVGAFWTLLFLPVLLHLLAARPAPTARGVAVAPDYTRSFWSDGFAPLPPTSLTDLEWFPRAFLSFFRDPLGQMSTEASTRGFYQAAGGMLLFVAGALWLRARRPFAAAALVLPFAVALVASGLKVYPFGGGWVTGGRVVLYLAPAACLLIGAGFEGIRGTAGRSMRLLPWLALVVAVAPSVAQLVMVFPSGRAEVKPMLAYYRDHHRPGDVLYVNYDARLQLGYYGERYGLRPGDYVQGPCSRLRPQGYVDALARLRGKPRVWVLFMDGMGAYNFDEKSMMTDYLNSVGRKLDARVTTGSALYLMDMRGPAPDAPPFRGGNLPRFRAAVEQGCALFQ